MSQPINLKQSITVTLHKGNGKTKSDPNNYRAISLLPVIFKIFEKVLLNRIEKITIINSINPLQHGFQMGKSCKMTSFILQEASNFCQERNGVLYACFLDTMKVLTEHV